MGDTVPVPHVPVPAVPGARAPTALARHAPSDPPFMSNMEEIAFWVTTKQAPCLYNYDNVIKKRCEEAHCLNISKPKSVQSMILETSPKKKKKRKLSLLDDESVSSGKHQNVYFETSQKKNKRLLMDSCKSDTLGSDLDFNIKSPSMRNKSKKVKLNKSNRTTLHKKNKIVTSTPKGGNLRRSLRRAQRCSNVNSHLNDSFEMFNCEIINSNNTKYSNIVSGNERTPKCKKAPELAGGDQVTHRRKQNCNETPFKQPVKINNGEFDDMSDVSGFTANYIRSTKLHSSKKISSNLRRKGSRNFMKESQQFSKKDDSEMIVCLNKSVNTGMPKTPLMNCSTDSSQNVINLVTLKNNDRSTRISRSTSLLKFIDTRNGKKIPCSGIEQPGQPSNVMNVSFLSKSSITSRYPIRHKTDSMEDISHLKFERNCQQVTEKRHKNLNELLYNSDRKENPVDKLISRTRSGKCIGLTVRQPENSVLVLSNSVEPVSSVASMNVATPHTRGRSKRRSCASTKPVDSVKKQDRSEQRQSLRDKSGFAACFSDTDEDNGPVKQKKFFC